MSIALTVKVRELEVKLNEVLARLAEIEKQSETNPEERPKRGRRRKDENE